MSTNKYPKINLTLCLSLLRVKTQEPVAAVASANSRSKSIKTFCVGLAADPPSLDVPHLDMKTRDHVLGFMNHAHNELGPHSIIYAAFGNYFFPGPQSASHLKILIEEIVSLELRVVFVVKDEKAELTGLAKDYIRNLERSGNVIFLEWEPQLEVLEHPSIHYFITHCGWSSVTEAIARGVPMICWPIAGDQPANSTLIPRHLNCGSELMQVRTGAAQSIAFGMNGDLKIIGSDEAVRDEAKKVLEMSRGDLGAQQRLKVQALSKVARESLLPGGSADAALGEFGNIIGL
ncbi:UDP-glucoronosyl and UDP-glucosyl transferase [Ceratobasidium sp. AG-Ba]|nr:UDP-glucoronosyl and UDP-glucosyl transferase [Ceratobasidium sp. AG-Ba]